MGLDIKNIDNMAEKVVNSSKKGFLYYFCQAYIIAAIIFAAVSIGGLVQKSNVNPDKNVTMEYLENHGISASLAILFILGGTYFCGRFISKKDAKDKNAALAKTVVDEEERRQERKRREHDLLVNYRISIGPTISNILKDLIINLGACKVCVFEMHNGTNNISGIPFLFADMLYEEANDESLYTIDEFKNLNLTRYGFIERHLKESSWCGTTDDLSREDAKLAEKLKIINVEYAAMMLLQGVEKPIGFLQIYFNTPNHPSNKEILAIANSAAQKITSLIDKPVVIEKLNLLEN